MGSNFEDRSICFACKIFSCGTGKFKSGCVAAVSVVFACNFASSNRALTSEPIFVDSHQLIGTGCKFSCTVQESVVVTAVESIGAGCKFSCTVQESVTVTAVESIGAGCKFSCASKKLNCVLIKKTTHIIFKIFFTIFIDLKLLINLI
ncbi:MAG: hypothetical protein WCG25_06920 [bacterium]